MASELELVEIEIDESIINEIKNLKFKHSNEINFENEYDTFKNIIKNTIDQKKSLKNFDYFLLAMVLEIAKKQPTSFWKTLWKELEVEENEESHYYRLFFNRIKNTLLHLGIDIVIKNGRRLVVETLQLKVESNPAFIKDVTDFFVYYYNNHLDEEIDQVLKNYPGFQKYKNKNKDKKFFIITIRLKQIVDFIIENHLEYIEDDKKLNSLIMKNLGIHPRELTRKRISTIVKSVLNRFTPRGFIKVLKNNYDKYVIVPDGRKFNCSHLINKNFGYGNYNISNKNYIVTPHLKFSLEEINDWSFNEIIELDNILFYKKRENFKFSKGNVRNFNYENESFRLWHSKVPIGEKIEMDNIIKIKEGFFWSPNIKFTWPKEKSPAKIVLEIDKINCFFKEFANQELILKTGKSLFKYKLNDEGLFSKRDIQFETENVPGDLTLEAFIGEKLIKKANFKLDKNLLFSGSSRKQIKGNEESPIVKKKYGEDIYYLFSTSKLEEIKKGRNIDLRELEKSCAYNVYLLNWKSSENFILKVLPNEWKIERKRFFEWYFNNNQNIFTSIKEMDIIGATNIDFNKFEEGLFFRILNKDHVPLVETIEIEKEKINSSFNISGEQLLEVTNDDLAIGEYILESYHENIMEEKTFYIIPEIDFQLPMIFLEGKKTNIKFKTVDGSKIFFDGHNKDPTNTIFKQIEAKVNYISISNLKPHLHYNDIILKLRLILSNDSTIDTKSFLVKEVKPKQKINIFGYRIYSNETNYLLSSNELNYYDIDKFNIFVFTGPLKLVELININNTIIIKKTANPEGICCFDDLSKIKDQCTTTETKLKIKSDSFVKELNIIRHPRINEIKSKWTNNKLYIKLSHEGPSDGTINLKIQNIHSTISNKTIKCESKRQTSEISIDLENFSNEKFIYLITYLSSFNCNSIRSKSFVIYNNNKLKTVLSADGEEIEVSLKSFQNKIVDVALYLLNLAKYSRLKIPKRSVQKEFLELLATLNSNVEFLLPYPPLKDEYKFLEGITGNESCIHILNEDNGPENIINPLKLEDIIEKGIGISSTVPYVKIKKYLPKPNPFVVIEAHKLDKSSIDYIIKHTQDRNLIFIGK